MSEARTLPKLQQTLGSVKAEHSCLLFMPLSESDGTLCLREHEKQTEKATKENLQSEQNLKTVVRLPQSNISSKLLFFAPRIKQKDQSEGLKW